MNLVRGVASVALIGVAGACCGAGSDTVNPLAENSGGRMAVVGLHGGGIPLRGPVTFAPSPFPKALDPWKVSVQPIGPKSQVGDSRAIPIPTQITGHAELIPMQWPGAKIVLCNR